MRALNPPRFLASGELPPRRLLYFQLRRRLACESFVVMELRTTSDVEDRRNHPAIEFAVSKCVDYFVRRVHRKVGVSSAGDSPVIGLGGIGGSSTRRKRQISRLASDIRDRSTSHVNGILDHEVDGLGSCGKR